MSLLFVDSLAEYGVPVDDVDRLLLRCTTRARHRSTVSRATDKHEVAHAHSYNFWSAKIDHGMLTSKGIKEF